MHRRTPEPERVSKTDELFFEFDAVFNALRNRAENATDPAERVACVERMAAFIQDLQHLGALLAECQVQASD